MASKVGMCNAALRKVGANTINSLTEGSEEARICNERFDEILDTLLQLHPWNFALHRAELSVTLPAPAFGYTNKYLLPTNPYCLKVESEDAGYDYVIEGRYLLSNYGTIKIKYIKRITDVNDLSAAFRECFSDYLAGELAVPLTGSLQLKGLMLQQFGASFKWARLRDAQEGTPETQPEGSWITTRQ